MSSQSPRCTPLTILRTSSVVSSPIAKYRNVVSRSECPSHFWIFRAAAPALWRSVAKFLRKRCRIQCLHTGASAHETCLPSTLPTHLPQLSPPFHATVLSRRSRCPSGLPLTPNSNEHEPDFARASIAAIKSSEIGTVRFSQSLGLKLNQGFSSTRMDLVSWFSFFLLMLVFEIGPNYSERALCLVATS